MIAFLKKIKKQLNPTYFALHQGYYGIMPHQVQCNICGYKTNQLQSDIWHEHAICPRCESGVRQRLLWAMLQGHAQMSYQTLIHQKKVLHFAPDQCFRDKIRAGATTYHTADFFAEGYTYPNIDFNIDMSHMPSIANQSYDCVIACDVLEHVPNDMAALQEIKRVLTVGGYCILTVPQKDHLQITDDDPSVTEPAEREKRFGQSDHLRIYGHDFKQRLESAGFSVNVVDENYFTKEQVQSQVLFPPVLSTHPMATNYRKIYVGQKTA